MTWRYAGCVPPLPEMGDEGWAEPGLTLLPNGELLTILRNGRATRRCTCRARRTAAGPGATRSAAV